MGPFRKDTLYSSFRSWVLAYAVELCLLSVAGIFLALHAAHLRADFPNHSPWMDWAKYTDEGWYGDAAIRYFQRGSWYVPGDFNPAVALPVWPLVESFVFHFTGVNIVAARSLTVAIFSLSLVIVYLLLRKWQGKSSLAPAAAVLLLAVSPFCYAFNRMAILEPMLVLLTLVALLAASYLPERGEPSSYWQRLVPSLALGLTLPLMVLTKTTAVFLFPAVGWVVFARSGYNVKRTLRTAGPIALLGFLIWASYYGLFVRPHFLSDYQYLFSANAYTGITPENALEVLRDTFEDGMWLGHLLYPLALISVIIALFLRPRLLKSPLLSSLLLWMFGYLAFIAYHDNLQPRYYLVLAVPLTVIPVIVFSSFWIQKNTRLGFSYLASGTCAAVLLLVAVMDARQTIGYVRSPEYTFANAAERIRQIIESDSTHNSLVLSISGSDLSLMTGLPSICDDFGTMELDERVKAYHPGWYVTWNQVDDDKMDALTPIYHLKRVASFPAMDDPERNLMILYRLDPPERVSPRRSRPRPIPQFLRTGFGQQADPMQLQH